MKLGINNYSEIGKLNKVLLHRLGGEIEALVPDNFERLLFDDIPYLKVAQKEHDIFAQLLRDNGVEVVYYTDETAKGLKDEKIKNAFIDDFLADSNVYSMEAKDAIKEYMSSMKPQKLVETAISGIKKGDVEVKNKGSLASYIASGYPYYTDPMPNLYFTRDPGACVGNGLNVHHMSTVARRRESLLLRYMYMYNKDFAPEGSKLWYDYNQDYSIEGGDVLVLSKDIVAIGLSQRTTAGGIERFAEN
ncbi:MAG: arginine deiminase family protein, partial [Anaerovoracaceae bacterium]